MAHKAYKYRLYPTAEQKEWLNRSFAAVRTVYNAALEQRNLYGRAKGTDPFGRDSFFSSIRQAKEINFKTIGDRKGLLDDPELSWICDAPRDCIDAALRDLDKAFQSFFKGQGGYPSFRKYDRNNSLAFKAWSRKLINGVSTATPMVVFGQNSIKMPKIGRVRYNRHKKFYGDPKTVEITKEGQEYFVVLVTKHDVKPAPHKGGEVGVDLGVELPVVLSTGEFITPDVGLNELEGKIRIEARKLSRKKKGSNRREKQKRKLAALKRHQARRRAANAHKATTELTRRFSLIAIEDLNIKKMTQSAKGDAEKPGENVKIKAMFNRALLNVAPFQFRSQLEYKAQRTGSKVIAVDPKYDTQTCNKCGVIDSESKQSPSKFLCTACGNKTNTHTNAALNILLRAKPSAGVSARRKASREFHQKSAMLKANGSCFQPALLLKSWAQSKGYT